MHKKLSVLFLAILLLPIAFTLAPHALATNPTRLYIDPPSIINQALVSTSTFNITVKIDNASLLAGVEFNVTWDPAILNGMVLQDIMFHQVTPPNESSNIWAIKNIVSNGWVEGCLTPSKT